MGVKYCPKYNSRKGLGAILWVPLPKHVQAGKLP